MDNYCKQKLDIQLLSNEPYKSDYKTFYCSNKNCIYNTLEDAIKSLKNSNYCITKEAEN